MGVKIFNESEVELSAIEWLEELGYDYAFGPDISEGSYKERESYQDVILKDRLLDALLTLNKNLSKSIIEDAIREILIPKQT